MKHLRPLPQLTHLRYPPEEAWREELYEGDGQLFTQEEVAASDERFLDANSAPMGTIERDGFIRYPIFHRSIDGELIEKEAWLHPEFEPSCTEGFFDRHRMETNIYVPSYQRAGTADTPKMFDRWGVKNYYLLIDPSQYETYREHYPLQRLVIRDITFREPRMLQTHSALRNPMTMAGHAPLCNFTLALSRSLGESHFTFADDDIRKLVLKARKQYAPAEPYDRANYYYAGRLDAKVGFDFQDFWHGLERLTKRLRNPGFVGPEMYGTAFTVPVCFRTGTRVYSFYITNNTTQLAHAGVQNNDVITSVELSRHGLANLLFEGVFYDSAPTQGGGGQTELYNVMGTFHKSTVLAVAQPAVSRIIYRYSRIHHQCDFRPHVGVRLVGAARPCVETKQVAAKPGGSGLRTQPDPAHLRFIGYLARPDFEPRNDKEAEAFALYKQYAASGRNDLMEALTQFVTEGNLR